MTGRSKARSAAVRAALGLRCHSGWAAFVVLGEASASPRILERGRMSLCDATITGSKQPFHEAEPMVFAAAHQYIEKCRASTNDLALRAMRALVDRYGIFRGCCLLTASGRPLPALRDVLESHALIHAAEGEFYRDAVAEAAKQMRIPVFRIRERDLDVAAERLPGSEKDRRERLVAFGKQVGAPWRQDEKLAALAAWLALAGKASQAKVSTLGV